MVAKNELSAYVEIDGTPPQHQANLIRHEGGLPQIQAVSASLGRNAGVGDGGVEEGQPGSGGAADQSAQTGAGEGKVSFDHTRGRAGPKRSATFTRDIAGLITSWVMKLFESRDLSTPIHEFGHGFLETLRMVAYWLANTANKVLTSDQVWASGALVTLTDGPTITPDFVARRELRSDDRRESRARFTTGPPAPRGGAGTRR